MNPERIVESRGIKVFIREETSDEFIVHEVIQGNSYRKINIQPTDIVVDFGLNIGTFTLDAIRKGAKVVYGFEPEPENFAQATKNIGLNDVKNAILFNEAVVGNGDIARRFSINLKKNKGAHSLVEKKGRDTIIVKCRNINNIIKEFHPTIIKMDIEGGEYECVKSVLSFAGVREFIMEFHHAHLNDIKTRAKYAEIINILKKHFAYVDFRPETKKAWVTIVYCRN